MPTQFKLPKCPLCGYVYDPRRMHEEQKVEKEGKLADQWKCLNCGAWNYNDDCEWVEIPLDAGSAIYGEKKKDSMEPLGEE